VSQRSFLVPSSPGLPARSAGAGRSPGKEEVSPSLGLRAAAVRDERERVDRGGQSSGMGAGAARRFVHARTCWPTAWTPSTPTPSVPDAAARLWIASAELSGVDTFATG